MAALTIKVFGGILPALDERELPPEAGTIAANLMPQLASFRPVLEPVVYPEALTADNPQTLYRLRSSGPDVADNWLAYADWTSHARWPMNDGGTERTTVSSVAGPPRVIDAGGENRLLGVPQPEAPAITVTVADYFTPAERVQALEDLRSFILRTARANLTRLKVGAEYTGSLIEGIQETGPEVATSPTTTRQRVHRYTARDGSITDPYVSGDEVDYYDWMSRSRLGKWVQSTGTPAWMGPAGTWHYALPYRAYGVGFRVNKDALTVQLAAHQHLDANQSSSIATAVAGLFDLESDPILDVLDPLREAVADFEELIDTPPTIATGAAVPQVVQDAVNTAALEIFAALRRNGNYLMKAGYAGGQ